MVTPTPPPRGPQPNLAAGQLNYNQQQVQVTTRGFGQLATLLTQITHLLSRSGPATATAGGAGFGASTFGNAPGTAAQWASRAQQRARMTATAAGRLGALPPQQQALTQLSNAHQYALQQLRAQQQIFAQQWQNTILTEAGRGPLDPRQQDMSDRRVQQATSQFQRRTAAFQWNVAEADRRHDAARDKLVQQRRDLEAQVRQGHLDQYQALSAMRQAQRLEGRRAAAGFGLEVGRQVVGTAAGALSAYYQEDDFKAIGQFGRRMSLISPMTGMTAGAKARQYGQLLRVGGLNNWASSTPDWVGGAQSVIMQTAPQFRQQALAQAGSNAFVSGLGVQAAAKAQAELGTSQSFYAAQLFGLGQIRQAGGRQSSLTDVALSIANRVNMNREGGFASLSKDDLAAQLSQGGSLSASLQTVGAAAGWSGQTMEMMRAQLEAVRTLMHPEGGGPGMDAKQAQETITKAADGSKKAIQALKDAGLDLGTSYQDAQNLLAGKSREGHLAQSADYLDAAKSSADSLTDIKNLLNKVLGPLAGAMGSLQGGGVLGAAASHPLLSTVLGGLAGPLGASIGILPSLMKGAGAAIGGGDAPVTPQRQNAAPGGGGSALPSGNAGSVIAAAEQQLGKPYLWGGTGPDGWDCSGLMQAAYKQGAGIDLPRVSEQQARVGVEVPMDQLLPGDLVFPSKESPPHVAMYIGGGRVIEAPRTGLNVREVPLGGQFSYARRVLGGGGSAAVPAAGDQNGTGTVVGGTKAASFTPLAAAGSYGSIDEVEALAAALSGSVGGIPVGEQGGTPRSPSAGQNETAASTSASGAVGGTTDQAGVKATARGLLPKYGFGDDQWAALEWLWTKESGWNPSADNPTSTAYGIPQALEWDPTTGTGHKMTGEFADYHTNATTQIKWGLDYIKGRYGTPTRAKQFWEAHNWYSTGAYDVPGDQVAKLHQGEMVLTRAQATTVRQALMEDTGAAPPAAAQASVHLDFQPGSIVISMPAASADGARQAATAFVDHIAADERIKSLMGGW
ncbi:NlpC/P60 family protein [Kitasatospora purpeofusca]|uniref:aggregation-promoting factor C-terminal-like domain-containing protein n=1 Tax=Kitasatospora purpeofusca TaxID=67352 RepID=UPI0036C16815